MEGHFDIMLKDKPVGQVTVSKESLYYKFVCSVKLSTESRLHLMACSENGCLDLGLCMPQGETFVLSKKVPVKRFQDNQYRYILSDRVEKRMIPISANKPFKFLNVLKDGYFSRDHRGAVIVINQKESNKA